MKKLTIIAALLMTTGHGYARDNSVSFQIEGHQIRIEAPKNCNQLSCLKISGFDFNGLNSKRFDDDDDDVVAKPAPSAQAPAPAPAAQATVPQAPAALAADTAPAPAPAAPANVAQAPAAPATNPAPAPVTVAATAPQPAVEVAPAQPVAAPQPAPVAAAAPVPAPTTPIGVWATEEGKGQVRILQCGQNLCGYAVKSGENILINMKPKDKKWVGTIHDPDSGRDYDSTIAMKGANSLRVQGCAFGGMFCGGQVWSRVS